MSYTEFSFTLPKGFVDEQGVVHRHGKMRPATGKDEIFVQKYHKTNNQEDRVFVALSQVITSLGQLSTVTPETLQKLFLVDFAYLQDFYQRLNLIEEVLGVSGEFLATPWMSCTKR
ncbi:MAG: phage tail assembly protein [Spirulinaceae cyanobacterium]